MAYQQLSGSLDAIAIEAKDDVATLLRDVAAGDTVTYRLGAELRTIQANAAIPFGHKIAIGAIPAGAPIHKYGEVIGRSTEAIKPGDHVHVHNLEGIRGRGDKRAEGNEAKA